MCNILTVTVVKRLKNLFKNNSCVFFTEVFFIDNFVEELATAANFCDKVDVSFVFEVLIEFQDVWVIEFLQNQNFLLESFHIFNLFFCYFFYGSFLFSRKMYTLTHDTICSCPHWFLTDSIYICNLCCILLNKSLFFN